MGLKEAIKAIKKAEEEIKEWERKTTIKKAKESCRKEKHIRRLEKAIEERMRKATEEIMQGNFRNAKILLAEAITFGKERMIDLLGEDKARKIWLE